MASSPSPGGTGKHIAPAFYATWAGTSSVRKHGSGSQGGWRSSSDARLSSSSFKPKVGNSFRRDVWKAHEKEHGSRMSKGASALADAAIAITFESHRKSKAEEHEVPKHKVIHHKPAHGGGPSGGGRFSKQKVEVGGGRKRAQSQSSQRTSFSEEPQPEEIVLPSLMELSTLLNSTATFLKEAARQPRPQIPRVASELPTAVLSTSKKQLLERSNEMFESMSASRSVQALSGHNYWAHDRPFWRSGDDDRPVSSTGIDRESWLKQRLNVWDGAPALRETEKGAATTSAPSAPAKASAKKVPPPTKHKKVDATRQRFASNTSEISQEQKTTETGTLEATQSQPLDQQMALQSTREVDLPEIAAEKKPPVSAETSSPDSSVKNQEDGTSADVEKTLSPQSSMPTLPEIVPKTSETMEGTEVSGPAEAPEESSVPPLPTIVPKGSETEETSEAIEKKVKFENSEVPEVEGEKSSAKEQE
eukprot:gnl/MRDRNA2_/MRDRNA2_57851_c0_seq1.p1 gnl/MRDRNA2_/MRDRNA2_57851_c0~~gnl/MRDRNA2_/MRDRNA2_57851_c0_seq1.p1  ORF type:complete len:476 (+),score=95.89 gnl/MRDRNA2_/MRDRNA2_57851_c0_seq1:75-1502(+)